MDTSIYMCIYNEEICGAKMEYDENEMASLLQDIDTKY